MQLESHRKTTYHRKGEPAKMCSRPKHPAKVHVWGGISKKGVSSIVISIELIEHKTIESTSKVNGRNKPKLDPIRIGYVKNKTFQM